MENKKDTLLNQIMFSVWALIMLFTLGMGLTSCSDDDDGSTGPGGDVDAVQTIQAENDLKLFAQYLAETGVESQLEGTGPFTIFAPTDDAFATLPEGYADSLTQQQLTEIVSYHIVSSAIASGDVENDQAVETLSDDSLYVGPSNGQVEVNQSATVTQADIEASNAFIHKVDNILLPDAYQDVYSIADKRFYATLFACSCTSGRTGLNSVLRDTAADFTVLVPTNAAFEEAGINNDSPSDEELLDILNYHIIEGATLSDELSDGQTLTSRNGAEITVSVSGHGTVSFNDGAASVVVADLEGINGVVHIIDTVLMPPSQ